MKKIEGKALFASAGMLLALLAAFFGGVAIGKANHHNGLRKKERERSKK